MSMNQIGLKFPRIIRKYKKYCGFIKKNVVVRPRKNHFYETHHIVPKCLGGGNDKSNLVLLRVENHFKAHFILAKESKVGKLCSVPFYMISDQRRNWNHKITQGSLIYKKSRTLYIQRKSELQKERCKNPEYIKFLSESTKNSWNEERLKNIRKGLKKFNKDLKKVKARNKKIAEKWKDPEFKKKCNWGRDNPEIQKKRIKNLKKALDNPNSHKLKILRSKQNWEKPGFRDNMKRKIKKRWKDPEYRKKQMESRVKVRNTKEYRKHLSEAVKKSWIERRKRK